MDKQYWLADWQDVDKYWTVWRPKLLDWPHDDIDWVAQAKKIIQWIGLDRWKNRNYVMVCIEAVPKIDVKVNEEAIKSCKEMVDWNT